MYRKTINYVLGALLVMVFAMILVAVFAAPHVHPDALEALRQDVVKNLIELVEGDETARAAVHKMYSQGMDLNEAVARVALKRAWVSGEETLGASVRLIQEVGSGKVVLVDTKGIPYDLVVRNGRIAIKPRSTERAQ